MWPEARFAIGTDLYPGIGPLGHAAPVSAFVRMDSDLDLDLVILCKNASDLLARTDWHGVFGIVELVSSRDFGGIQERRLRRASGFEIEVGIGPTSWAAVPVDPGTAEVALGGLVPLYDADGHLRRLLDALTGPEAPTPRLRQTDDRSQEAI